MRLFLITVAVSTVPVFAQAQDVCDANQVGLYSKDCVDELRARIPRVALQQAERTCNQVGEALASTPYRTFHVDSGVDGTRCRVEIEQDFGAGSDGFPAQINGGTTAAPPLITPIVGGTSTGMEVDIFATLQAQATAAQFNDFADFAGTSEAIVEQAPLGSIPLETQLFIDLDAIGESFTVDATTDEFLILRDATSRLVVDAQTGAVLGERSADQ